MVLIFCITPTKICYNKFSGVTLELVEYLIEGCEKKFATVK